MKVFVINLDRRMDRLESISKTLGGLGIEFERIPAIDGDSIKLEDHVHRWLSWIYEGCSSPLPSVVGCFLSHRKAWQKICDENLDQALILEDDVRFVNWNHEILKVKIEDYGLDILRLGANKRQRGDQVKTGSKRPITFDDESILGRRLSSDQTLGSCAYIMTLSGAKKSLVNDKYWFDVDVFSFWRFYYGIKSKLVFPLMVEPDDSKSDIPHKQQFKNLGPFKRTVRKVVRESLHKIGKIYIHYSHP
jgi:glycosyl transferase, family 25